MGEPLANYFHDSTHVDRYERERERERERAAKRESDACFSNNFYWNGLRESEKGECQREREREDGIRMYRKKKHNNEKEREGKSLWV